MKKLRFLSKMACHIICFVSFRSVSFRSVSFRSVLFRFALYRDPQSSEDGHPTLKMSPNCRPIVGRWTTDEKQYVFHEYMLYCIEYVRVVHIFNMKARRRPIWECPTR